MSTRKEFFITLPLGPEPGCHPEHQGYDGTSSDIEENAECRNVVTTTFPKTLSCEAQLICRIEK